jgi:urease accessory protein
LLPLDPIEVSPSIGLTKAAVQAGWVASLDLRLDSVDAITRIVRRRHVGPLLVQRAFYPESVAAAALFDRPCHVYLVHPPGGVASGDDLRLDVEVTVGAHALLTTPAAGKFYRRGSAGASRLIQSLNVDRAALEWLPQENIFYPNAATQLSTHVRLRGKSRFIGWEIACFGLPASGGTLESGSIRQNFELWLDGRPLYLDRVTVQAASLAARWGLAGDSTLGTWVGFPADRQDLEAARAIIEMTCRDSTAACTLVDGALVCRGVSSRADRLKQVFVELWSGLRPRLVGREAVPPRVWAT